MLVYSVSFCFCFYMTSCRARLLSPGRLGVCLHEGPEEASTLYVPRHLVTSHLLCTRWTATWPPGHLATWPPGHLTTWPPGHLATWPPGHLATWPTSNMPFVTWPPGHLAPLLHVTMVPVTCLGRRDSHGHTGHCSSPPHLHHDSLGKYDR